MLREFDFELHVATKGPYNRPNAWAEKVKWCHKHLRDASVHVVDDKSLLYGKVLVDDWPAYVEKWLEWRPRGLVVMPAYGYNAHLDGHPNIIRMKVDADFKTLRERLATL